MSEPTPLPDAFSYLCDWGNDSYGLTRQTVYYGEPGSAIEDDWSEHPRVHKNTKMYTSEQMTAYGRAEYLRGVGRCGACL